MHGGMLHAHSDGEGRGSVFFMELPLFVKKKDSLRDLNNLSDHLCLSVDSGEVVMKQDDDDETKECSALPSHMDFADSFSTADSKLCSTSNPSRPLATTKKKTRPPPQLGLTSQRRPSASHHSLSQSKGLMAEQDCKEWRAGLNILIVDDSLTNRKVMMKLLSSYGRVNMLSFD